MKLRVQLLAFLGVLMGVWTVNAQTFVWSPTAATGVFELNTNWVGSVAPTAGGALVFGTTAQPVIALAASINVASVSFDGTGGPLSYSFGSTAASLLRVGSGGIAMPNTGSGSITFTSSLGLELTANQTWNVGGSSWSLGVAGPVTGAFSLRKTGEGSLTLGATNSYAGGTTINGGVVELLANGALGATTGSVTMNATGTATWTALEIGGTSQTIGTLTFGGTGAVANSFNSIGMAAGGRLTLGGDVTYDATNRPGTSYISGGTLVLGGNRTFQVAESPNAYTELMIESVIEGAGAGLIKTGAGMLELFGNNTYTGGTTINHGTLRLSAAAALPAAGNIVINATSGPATLEVGVATPTIGSLTFGGAGALAFGRNRITMFTTGSLTLGGTVTLLATNGPGTALIEGGIINLGAANRVFNIGDSLNADRDLTITSRIDGTGAVTKDGAGTLELSAANTFAGGVTVNAGTLLVGTSSLKDGSGSIISGAVGRGTLTLQSGTTLGGFAGFFGSTSDELVIANPVALANNVTLGAGTNNGSALKFSGPVTASAAATTVNLANEQDVFFTGTLAGAAAGTTLTFHSGSGTRGFAVLGGTTGATITNLVADRAAVIIGSSTAVPATLTLGAINGGYLGVAATPLGPTPSAVTVLGRITDKTGFSGTFGLDSDMDSGGAAHVFTENLDLSGFGTNFTFGSASLAILTGTITPSSLGYQFGNGGGGIVLRTNLADVGGSKAVSVNSTADRPLFAIFQGNNTYTGSFSVTSSAGILDSATALPAGRAITLGAHGYVGYTEAFTGTPSFTALATRVTSHANTSILGLDSHDYITTMLTGADMSWSPGRLFTGTVDLTGLASIYLGSATHAIVLGTVLAPNLSGASRTLSLIGVSRGLLEIRSRLTAGNVTSVVAGSPTTPFDPGTVLLAAQNTYAGGTTLHSGTLLLADSSRLSGTTIVSGPLGTGALAIPDSGRHPTLASASELETVIHNPILLGGVLQLGLREDGEMFSASSSSDFGSFYHGLVLRGVISDFSATQIGSLHVQGDTTLAAANTFTGGVYLEGGQLVIGHNSALGTGLLNITPMSFEAMAPSLSLSTGDAARTIANNVVLNSSSSGSLPIVGHGSLTITGSLVLNGNVHLAPERNPLFLNGPVTGPSPLKSAGSSPIILGNTGNTYFGGTISDGGPIIFATAGSIPASNLLTANSSGYIGVASPTFVTSLQANFLERFNKLDTDGTIGFDTIGTGTTNTFSTAVDLTGFNSDARMGSATRAILSGTITPQAGIYNFGGGGGTLEVNSVLADGVTLARSVWVSSYDEVPLTLRLGGANTYTAGTLVDNSAVIFKAGALPATGQLNATSGGYIGTEDTALAPGDFIARFNPSMRDALIGFDSFTATPYAVSGGLLLTRFDSISDPRIFIATATSATINGTITLPAAQNVYRFAGYKGGQLTIASLLDGTTRSVEIGDPLVTATFRSPSDAAGVLSSVTLSGANTYQGGTKLFGGALGIGSNSALGLSTTTLTIAGMSTFTDYDERPMLFAAGAARTVANPIRLEANLEVGGTEALTLAGVISASGGFEHQIYKTGTSVLTLSGNNTFDGGIYIAQGNVSFSSLNAAGTGMLKLGGPLGPSASFLETAVVNGIAGDSSLDLINIAADKTLTVNQTMDATYAGQFSFGSGASLIYKGPVAAEPFMLRLTGNSSYSGATKVGSGIVVVAAANNAFGASSNTVQVDGGKLLLDAGTTLSNALTLTAGTIGGAGTFQTPATLAIKTGVFVAPGFGHPGTLTFNAGAGLVGNVLSLQSGGTYAWQLGDATNAAGGWDRIVVSGTVDIAATALAPFTFKIIPAVALDLMGSVANFDPTQTYSWTVLSASSITNFDAGAFTINSSLMGGIVSIGTFSLSLDGTSTNVLLNFSPVPEPSTYALVGIGAVILFWSQRRRRRWR